jgi:hypothetical protein
MERSHTAKLTLSLHTPCREWALDRKNGYGIADFMYELDGAPSEHKPRIEQRGA